VLKWLSECDHTIREKKTGILNSALRWYLFSELII
jgi:kinesin family member 13